MYLDKVCVYGNSILGGVDMVQKQYNDEFKKQAIKECNEVDINDKIMPIVLE